MEASRIPRLSVLAHMSHVREFREERLSFLGRAVRECGSLAMARLRNVDVLVVSDPQMAHEVLVEKGRAFEKSAGTRLALYPLGGDGLFTSEGALWKRQRKLMAPMFRHEEIAGFAECMTGAAHRAAARLHDGDTIEVAKATTQIAMSIVGKALFDAETFDEADELGEALTTALGWADALLGSRQMFLQLYVRRFARRLRDDGPSLATALGRRLLAATEMPVGYYGPGGRDIRRAVAKIDARVARMVADRRAAGWTRQDLLTQLLRAHDDDGATMTDRQVRDEAVTLFVAGHETTANGLAWAFHELAKNPEIYARVRDEADSFAGRTPRLEQLGGLSYCLRVFKEALRLYPPVYVLMRVATSEVDIGGYDVPKGTVVAVSAYGIHRNPAIYPDPARFDPDRFEPSAEAGRHRSAWLPFGGGPRVCIGNHFALLEGQLVLAALSHRVTFELKPGVDVRPAPLTTLRPSGGMPMIVRRRDLAPTGSLSPAA